MMAWPTLISPEALGSGALLTTPLCPDLGPRSPRVGWPEGVEGPDGQPLKVEQAKALAELERALPPWVELRDAEGTLIALTAEGPGAGAIGLSARALKEACQALGARELLLAWAGDDRARVEDAWAATTSVESLAAWSAAAGGGACLLVARDNGVCGVVFGGERLGLSGAPEALPSPATAGLHPMAGLARGVFGLLLGVMLALAALLWMRS
jgi:hypothetical protein